MGSQEQCPSLNVSCSLPLPGRLTYSQVPGQGVGVPETLIPPSPGPLSSLVGMETKPSLGVLVGQGVDPAQAEASCQDGRCGSGQKSGGPWSQRRIFLSGQYKCGNRTIVQVSKPPPVGSVSVENGSERTSHDQGSGW